MKSQAIFAGAVAVALFVLGSVSPVEAARWPDWAARAFGGEYVERYADEDAVILLDEWDLTLKGGARSGKRRWVLHILSEDGSEHAGLTLPSNHFGQYGRVRMWVSYPNGRTVKFSKEEGSLFSAASRKILDDTELLVLSPPSVRPGTLIAIEAHFERIADRPQDLFTIQHDIPVLNSSITVDARKGWSVHAKSHGGDGAGPSRVTETGTWHFTDVPGVHVDSDSDSPQPPRILLALNYSPSGSESPFEDWRSVVAWSRRLFRQQEAEMPRVKAVAAELSATGAGLVDKIGKRARELRYFGVELGWGGFQPRPPELTLTRAFGDCKDKSQLMVTLLREAGIEAFPVLIIAPSDGFVPDEVPSPFVFNHAVVAIPWTEPPDDRMSTVDVGGLGTLRIFDPTLSDRSGQDISPHLEGAAALILHPDISGVIRLPASDAESNVAETLHRWTLDERGNLTGQTTVRLHGAMRMSLEAEGGEWEEPKELRERVRTRIVDAIVRVEHLAVTPVSEESDGAWAYEATYLSSDALGEFGELRRLELEGLLSPRAIPLPAPDQADDVAYLPFRGVVRHTNEISFTGKSLIGRPDDYELSNSVGSLRLTLVRDESESIVITREVTLNSVSLAVPQREDILELRAGLKLINDATLVFEPQAAR